MRDGAMSFLLALAATSHHVWFVNENAGVQKSPRKPVSRVRARNAALINLCATPGLGSVTAGRIGSGVGQLALAIAGFVVFVIWFVRTMTAFYAQMSESPPPTSGGGIRLALVGASLFVAAWLWSLVTSLSLLREARRAETASLFAGQ